MLGTKLPNAASRKAVCRDVESAAGFAVGRKAQVIGVPNHIHAVMASLRGGGGAEPAACGKTPTAAYLRHRDTFVMKREVSSSLRSSHQRDGVARASATAESSSVASSGDLGSSGEGSVKCRISTEFTTVFGDSLMVVGSTDSLGCWWPANGLEMTWTDGHIWTCEVDLPLDEDVYFKFIMKTGSGDLWWEPSSNREISKQLGRQLDVRGQFGVEGTIVSVCDEDKTRYSRAAEETGVTKKAAFEGLGENVNQFYSAITKGLGSSAYMESKIMEANELFSRTKDEVIYRFPSEKEANDVTADLEVEAESSSVVVPADFKDSESVTSSETVEVDAHVEAVPKSVTRDIPVKQVVPEVLPDEEESKSTSTALAPLPVGNNEVFVFLESLAETLATQLSSIDPQKQLQRVKLQATATISNVRQVAEAAKSATAMASEGVKNFKESANTVTEAVRNAKSRKDLNELVMSLLKQTKAPRTDRMLGEPEEKK